MSTVTQQLNSIPNAWSCPRCYRMNFQPDTDDNCFYGCGYKLEDYIHKDLGWKCPQCFHKNVTRLFSKYMCNKCHYRLNIDDLDKMKFE